MQRCSNLKVRVNESFAKLRTQAYSCGAPAYVLNAMHAHFILTQLHSFHFLPEEACVRSAYAYKSISYYLIYLQPTFLCTFLYRYFMNMDYGLTLFRSPVFHFFCISTIFFLQFHIPTHVFFLLLPELKLKAKLWQFVELKVWNVVTYCNIWILKLISSQSKDNGSKDIRIASDSFHRKEFNILQFPH